MSGIPADDVPSDEMFLRDRIFHSGNNLTDPQHHAPHLTLIIRHHSIIRPWKVYQGNDRDRVLPLRGIVRLKAHGGGTITLGTGETTARKEPFSPGNMLGGIKITKMPRCKSGFPKKMSLF